MTRPRLAALLLFLATEPGPASAAPIDECRSGRDPAARLAACSDAVERGGTTAAEKAVAYRIRGDLRVAAGAADEAILDYSAALDIDRDDGAAHAGRARAWLVKGDLNAAIADFSAAIELASSPAAKSTLLIRRGHALMLEGRLEPAIVDLDEAVRLNPKSASARNHRGLAYRRSGDLPKALAEYTAAIELNPVYALAYNNRGYAYEALGWREEAIADFSRALLLDASLTGASDGLKRLKAEGLLAGESAKLVAEGKAIVEASCSFCHAVGRTGTSPNPKAPEFRTLAERHPELALREPLSRGIAAPHDVMPKFTLTEAEIDRIIAYINSLE